MPKIPTNEEFDKKLLEVHGENIIRLGERTHNQEKILCKCIKCNFEWSARIRHLLNGSKCPECRKMKEIDFDNICERLFNGSLKRTEPFKGVYKMKIKMKCLKCNNEQYHQVRHVLSGHGCVECARKINKEKQTFSLEKMNKKTKELNGDLYEILERDEDKLKIKCKKHGIFYQNFSDHFHKNSKCPKCRESKGEQKIRRFLENNKINYIKNKRFEGCKNKRCLPFDFYIEKLNVVIEYDGEQHFNEIRFGYGKYMNQYQKEEYLKLIKYRDNIKNKFCEDNHIKIIKIPYTEFNNIDNILTDKLLNQFISGGDL